jgi:membrane peptidoglycan carboxypeptidase
VSTRDFPPRGRRSGYDTPDRSGYDGPRRGRSSYDAPEGRGYEGRGYEGRGYDGPRPRRARSDAPGLDDYDGPRRARARSGTRERRGYDGPRRARARYEGDDGYGGSRRAATATRSMRSGGGHRQGDPDGTRMWSGGGGGGGRRRAPNNSQFGGWNWRGGLGGLTWKKLVAYGVIASGVGVVIVSVLVGFTYAKTPIPSAASQFALSQQSTVYFSDGKSQIGTFGDVNRQILQPGQMPEVMQEAAISAEDRNFYHEGGVSPTGIMRAFYEDLSGGGIAQGGSTITQQFVRNYYSNIGTQQTFSRKFKEIFVATKVARAKSKDWILTQYLNTINLGRAYGVGAASQAYFGKPVSKLDVGQAAALAAIIQLPNVYSTPAGRSALQVRWNYVLDGMEKLGFLNPAQRPTQMPKFIPEHSNNDTWSGYRGYVMEAVDYELKHTYGYTESQIENGGLHVVTTFDKKMENDAYNAVSQNVAEMKASGAPMPSYAHVGMTVIQPSGPNAGGVVATYSGKNWAEQPQQCAKDYCQEDMALAARNQPGSSFKPYVLATAVREGISIKSVLDGRSPLCIPPDSMPNTKAQVMNKAACNSQHPGWYSVANDQGDITTSKPADMTSAMAYSLNTAYVDLTHQVGTDNVIKLADALGVDPNSLSGFRGDTGIALGIASLSSEEQASTFATFASGGWYVTPHVIAKLGDNGGNNIHLKITRTQVFNPQQAGAIDYALSKDSVYGTAKRFGAMPDGRELISKTGTTENAQAAWYIGAIPQYAVSVGMFTNDQSGKTKQSLNGVGGLPGYGGDWPTKIWRSFADTAMAGLPDEPFPAPYFGGRMLQQAPPPPKPKPTPTQAPTPKPTKTCDPASGTPCGKHKSPQPCLPGDPTCTTPQPSNSPPPTGGLFGGGGGGPGGGGTNGGGGGAAVEARRMGGG